MEKIKYCKKVCEGCPFKKNSLRGWLGPYKSPSELHNLVLTREVPFPCHEAQNAYEEKTGEDTGYYDTGVNIPYCAGALMYARKAGKLFHNPKVQQIACEFSNEDKAEILSVRELHDHHTIEKP